MKLLSRQPGRLVFQLRSQDRNSLRGLLRLGSECRRSAPRITRGPMECVPDDAEAMLAEALAEQRASDRNSVLAWLEDGGRCQPGKGGFGLTLTEAEFEQLLQALNHAKMSFWESLGCPDPDAPSLAPETPRNQTLAYAIELANLYIGFLVESVAGGPAAD